MSILSIPLRIFSAWEGVSPRHRDWERILEAALEVPRYRAIRARLEWARHTAKFRIDPGFAEPVGLRDFCEHAAQFRSRRGSGPTAVPIEAPWPGARACLALQPWFPLEDSVGILHRAGFDSVMARQPETLAGTLEALRDLAREVLERKSRIETLRWGVIVLSGPGRPVLTERDRDLLWEAFEVPMWEQYRGFHGEILAEQCEAPGNWHPREENAIWEGPVTASFSLLVTSLRNSRYPVLRLDTGVRAEIVNGSCACGRRGMRAVLR